MLNVKKITAKGLIFFGLLMFFTNFSYANSRPKEHIKTEKRDDLTADEKIRVEAITKETKDFTKAERFETLQGGAGTSRKIVNQDAFSHPLSNLSLEEEKKFRIGNALFRKLWVTSPASTKASDGLGPLFNARSCQSCHIKDGRGHPPEGDEDITSMLIKLARPARNELEKDLIKNYLVNNFGDSTYGNQLQDLAVVNLSAEGKLKISYKTQIVKVANKKPFYLRRPNYSIIDLAYGKMDDDTTLSPRIANQMIGLGLIEAIHKADIINLADEHDKNNDGISGKVQWVKNTINKKIEIGRFGWKAAKPNIRLQSTGAFSNDIGISSDEFQSPFGDCTKKQPSCFKFATGVQTDLGEHEAPTDVIDLVTFYSANLAVPARRNVNDKQVLKGKKIFYEIGCTACHTPKFVTNKKASNKAKSFQLIWPYSDFLLHDMGKGLRDNQKSGRASGQEWRTPPLWGIGLTKEVNNHTFFLHDGRARNLTEAILWHGGEGLKAKNKFLRLSDKEQKQIISFLESL